MMKSYAQWEKYDADAELRKEEELEKRENRQKDYRQLSKDKIKLENEIANKAQMSAAALKSHAAVAALKAKQQRKKMSSEGEDIDEASVKLLQTKAELLSSKSENLKQILTMRNQGQESYKAKKYIEAIENFNVALSGVHNLDVILPKLEELQLLENVTAEVHCCDNACQENNKHCHDHHHNANDNCCGKKEKKKTLATLPKTSDLSGVVKMFRRDCIVGIGKCELELERYASSTQSFKEVLLHDRTCVDAWLGRGRAFGKIGLPLLAMLHYNQVLIMDQEHDDAKDEEELVVAEVHAISSRTADEMRTKDEKFLRLGSLRELIDSMSELRSQADIIMLEAFYASAIRKYEVILKGIDQVNNIIQLSPAGKEHEALQKTRLACHLNIAACYLKMEMNYAKAIQHCNSALQIEKNNAVAIFRRAQAFHRSHRFIEALNEFERLQKQYLNAEQLSIVNAQMDKCRFDRDHLDATYVKSLLDAKNNT